MSQPTQQGTDLKDFLIFARRLALMFADWVAKKYDLKQHS